jgi:hypothetical protein
MRHPPATGDQHLEHDGSVIGERNFRAVADGLGNAVDADALPAAMVRPVMDSVLSAALKSVMVKRAAPFDSVALSRLRLYRKVCRREPLVDTTALAISDRGRRWIHRLYEQTRFSMDCVVQPRHLLPGEGQVVITPRRVPGAAAPIPHCSGAAHIARSATPERCACPARPPPPAHPLRPAPRS